MFNYYFQFCIFRLKVYYIVEALGFRSFFSTFWTQLPLDFMQALFNVLCGMYVCMYCPPTPAFAALTSCTCKYY